MPAAGILPNIFVSPFTSPRKRGEVGADPGFDPGEATGEGQSRIKTIIIASHPSRAPHPNPLPAGGERENFLKRLRFRARFFPPDHVSSPHRSPSKSKGCGRRTARPSPVVAGDGDFLRAPNGVPHRRFFVPGAVLPAIGKGANTQPTSRSFRPGKPDPVQPLKAAGHSAHGRLPGTSRTDGSVDHRRGRRPLPHGRTGSSPWPSREGWSEYNPIIPNVKLSTPW